GNPELVKHFSAQGAPYAARVGLISDAASANGYTWSAGKGPPVTLSAGTTATAEITVRTQAPVTLVLPLLREKTGLGGCGPAELGELPLPSIIHWNFNHFVVFEGLDGEWARINDPAIGRRRVSRAEFSEAFTGVVLALEPTAEFRRAGAPPRAIPMLWRQLS